MGTAGATANLDVVKTQQEKADERRKEKLAEIQRQVKDGTLKIRKMTAKERAKHPPKARVRRQRAPGARPSRGGGTAPRRGRSRRRSAGDGFALAGAKVTPRRAYFGGRELRMRFRFSADGPLDLRIEIRRRGADRPARRWLLRDASPLEVQGLTWDGRNARGKAARDGAYRVSVGPPGRPAESAGSVVFHGHFYPVRGPHWFRGPVGQFGAPRSGGRVHEGFDVNAACGTPLVAARAGRVRYSAYDPVLYGHRVIIRGLQTGRDYWYSHLLPGVPVEKGDRVRTGQRIGRIGATGNARTVGCHLHFEVRALGAPIDPEPLLRAWDGWS